MVTCGTYQKTHVLSSEARLDFFSSLLFDVAAESGWSLHAWAVLSNHYHIVASSPENPGSLPRMLSKLHTLSAREFNRDDNTPGRKVWFQFFDTHLTYQASYFARLNYVHHNPVHHGIVQLATEYRWCSYGWFERTSKISFYKTVMNFKTDHVHVVDDFEPIAINNGKSGVKPPHSESLPEETTMTGAINP
jgi:putative transposase